MGSSPAIPATSEETYSIPLPWFPKEPGKLHSRKFLLPFQNQPRSAGLWFWKGRRFIGLCHIKQPLCKVCFFGAEKAGIHTLGIVPAAFWADPEAGSGHFRKLSGFNIVVHHFAELAYLLNTAHGETADGYATAHIAFRTRRHKLKETAAHIGADNKLFYAFKPVRENPVSVFLGVYSVFIRSKISAADLSA